MTTIQDRVAQTVREYDAQGVHRTGTAVDLASARWLADQIQARGHEAHLEPFTLDRVIPGDSFLEIDGDRISGIPLFDGTFTDEAGVSGMLGPAGSDVNIALVDFAPSGPDALAEARRFGKHAAIVGVVPSDPPGLAIRNAPNFATPSGIPVLQVSSIEHERLTQAAAAGSSARLVAHATIEQAEAQNVVVDIEGNNADLPPLVVMTPRSGWFNCAIERGGGIACWLEILSAFRNNPPDRNVTLIATSGHELGHLGLESFIESNPELPTVAKVWLHLGASIGAAVRWKPYLQTSDRQLETAALDCFTAPEFEGLPELSVHPTGQVHGGEAQQIHARGGRYVSFVGGNALFHLEADRWPDAVDLPALTAYADALAKLAVRLAA